MTGHSADGRAILVQDGSSPRTHDYESRAGMSTTLVWSTAALPQLEDDGRDPTGEVTSFHPEPGETRCVVLRIPATSGEHDFDPRAVALEQRQASPGLAERFEPDAPGMHTTDTVDYCTVLSGSLWLELDDGFQTEVSVGDVIVQNGTRHAWRNRGSDDAVLLAVLVGARRSPA